MLVRLEEVEIRLCYHYAQLLETRAQKNGFAHKPAARAASVDPLMNHYRSNLVEFAVAKRFDIYPSMTYEGLGLPDVGGFIQVRATHYATGCMIIKPTDPRKYVYLLGIVQDLTDRDALVRLSGWLRGHELDERGEEKSLDNVVNRWIGQRELRPMHEFEERFNHRRQKLLSPHAEV